MGAKLSDYGAGRSAFWLERPDLGSERRASGFERLHFGSKASLHDIFFARSVEMRSSEAQM